MINDGIGGYFQLELSNRGAFLHNDGVLVNSGRNALEYILRSLPVVRHIWLPYYTCDVVLEPIEILQISYSFYHIDERLHISETIPLEKDDYILYTNYFGLMDGYIRSLVKEYGKRLIVDNAQAWFAKPQKDVGSIYSPRKFFGVPDGGIAFSPYTIDSQFEQDTSFNRSSHLLKRIDLGPSEGYTDFNENRKTFHNQPIRIMSLLTQALLKNIDYPETALRRCANYKYLDSVLGNSNQLHLSLDEDVVPMAYPYLTNDSTLKKKLIDNRIFVATFWPNVMEWCDKEEWEYYLTKNTCFLPIDQRYGEKEMKRIIDIIMVK